MTVRMAGTRGTSTFESLRTSRNYRLFFFGQMVSMGGTWMQGTAQSWLVYKILGAGAGAIGVMFGLQFTPALFLSAWYGALVDRSDRRKLLIVTQTAMACSAATLAVLTLSGSIDLWTVYVLAMVTGTFSSLDATARQSFTVEMVGRDAVSNAAGLTSMMVNVARIIGPAIAGFLLEAGVTPGWCFVLNACSYIAVIGALAAMRPDELHATPPVERARGQVRAGLRYVWATPMLRRLLLAVFLFSTVSMNQAVILPVLATETFHSDAGLYGTMSAIIGAGAVMAGLLSARRGLASMTFIAGAALGAAGAAIAAGLSPTWQLSLVSVFFLGLFTMTLFTTASPNLSLGCLPEMRGRVMALYTLAVFGSTAIGAPLMGWLVRHHGPRVGLVASAIGSVGVAVILGLRPLAERHRQTAAVASPSGVQ